MTTTLATATASLGGECRHDAHPHPTPPPTAMTGQTDPQPQRSLQGALARREPWGVWGGELFDAGGLEEAQSVRPALRALNEGVCRGRFAAIYDTL